MPKIDCDKSFLQSIDSRFQIPELERADEPNGNWGGGEHDPRGSPRGNSCEYKEEKADVSSARPIIKTNQFIRLGTILWIDCGLYNE